MVSILTGALARLAIVADIQTLQQFFLYAKALECSSTGHEGAQDHQDRQASYVGYDEGPRYGTCWGYKEEEEEDEGKASSWWVWVRGAVYPLREESPPTGKSQCQQTHGDAGRMERT